jgi:antitoxin VapB
LKTDATYRRGRLSLDAAKNEIAEKERRLDAYLDERNLDAVLLTETRNVFWATGGAANNQIVLNKDVGAASILYRKGGGRFLICSQSEVDRLMDEALGALGYRAAVYRWFDAEAPARALAETGGGRVASDAPFPGTDPLPEDFKRLRYRLADEEIDRYRRAAEQATEAVSNVCRTIRPGMNEYEIEALTAKELRERGLLPTVLLIAADERIHRYRHALAGGAELKRYAMINVVAESRGMPVAVTRLVHFGEPPDELRDAYQRLARVNAAFQHAARAGARASDVFERCKTWYADAGFEGEWRNHHQGGAIGYDDREYIVTPDCRETFVDRQAFAFNPTAAGAKYEDTILIKDGGVERLTQVEDWEDVVVEIDGVRYAQAAPLVRNDGGTR